MALALVYFHTGTRNNPVPGCSCWLQTGWAAPQGLNRLLGWVANPGAHLSCPEVVDHVVGRGVH